MQLTHDDGATSPLGCYLSPQQKVELAHAIGILNGFTQYIVPGGWSGECRIKYENGHLTGAFASVDGEVKDIDLMKGETND